MASGKGKKKTWSFSVGTYGCTVRAYERPGGRIWLQKRLHGKVEYENLGIVTREAAEEEAKRALAEMTLGLGQPKGTATLGATLDGFLVRQQEREDAGEIAQGSCKEFKRQVAFWKAALGADADPTAIVHDDLDSVRRKRKSGALDAHGEPVALAKRKPVRDRAAGSDLEFLRSVLRWAVHKTKLFKVRVNAMDGYEIPDDPNPRRPVATYDRYEKTREKAPDVLMELRAAGVRVRVPSWLPELLDLAQHTGRRLGAIVALKYADLRLDVTPDAPHGAIHWPADTDKMGQDWDAPLSAPVRSALDRVLVDREVGVRAKWPTSPYLFPSPRNASRPVSKDLASAWLEEAEQLAKLPKLDGSLWHAYRRGWATARKNFPLSDVAAAGGWKDTTCLRTIYTQADKKTVLRVVLEPMHLGEGGK